MILTKLWAWPTTIAVSRILPHFGWQTPAISFSKVGSTEVQERLLNEGQKLDLTRSIQIARQFELAQQQVKEMRGEDASVTVARVNTQKPHYKSRQNSKLVSNRGASRGERRPAARDNVDSDSTCGRCGKESTHTRTRGKCPAFGAQCSFCKKMNHWHTVCRKRLAHEVRALQADSQEQADSDSDSIREDGYACAEGKEYMLSASKVELPHHRKQDKWVVPLEVGGNGTNVTFRIDTGARCNVMVQDTYRKVAAEGTPTIEYTLPE